MFVCLFPGLTCALCLLPTRAAMPPSLFFSLYRSSTTSSLKSEAYFTSKKFYRIRISKPRTIYPFKASLLHSKHVDNRIGDPPSLAFYRRLLARPIEATRTWLFRNYVKTAQGNVRSYTTRMDLTNTSGGETPLSTLYGSTVHEKL